MLVKELQFLLYAALTIFGKKYQLLLLTYSFSLAEIDMMRQYIGMDEWSYVDTSYGPQNTSRNLILINLNIRVAVKLD